MASNKTKDKKEFLISAREKIRPGLSGAPVWAMQKSGDRIWSAKAKRNWKNIDLGKQYLKRKRKTGD